MWQRNGKMLVVATSLCLTGQLLDRCPLQNRSLLLQLIKTACNSDPLCPQGTAEVKGISAVLREAI